MGRNAVVAWETRETSGQVELELDGSGRFEITTGIGMLNHLLAQLARHGRFDLRIEAEGDLDVDGHHTVEDIGLALGKAMDQALGDRAGIVRMGDATVPLDEALALVAVDLGGRGTSAIDSGLQGQQVGQVPGELIDHLLDSLARQGRFSLHVRLLAGAEPHHKAEAIFKALARALNAATRPDPRLEGETPSTKGTLGG